MAAFALAGVLLPGIGKAIKIDAMIGDYAEAAAKFKNLQGEFRRARLVWSHKSLAEFEEESRKHFKAMNDARKLSLTPPEWFFKLAQRKIKAVTTIMMPTVKRQSRRERYNEFFFVPGMRRDKLLRDFL